MCVCVYTCACVCVYVCVCVRAHVRVCVQRYGNTKYGNMRKSIRKQDFKFEYRKNIPVIVKGRHTLKLYI